MDASAWAIVTTIAQAREGTLALTTRSTGGIRIAVELPVMATPPDALTEP